MSTKARCGGGNLDKTATINAVGLRCIRIGVLEKSRQEKARHNKEGKTASDTSSRGDNTEKTV